MSDKALFTITCDHCDTKFESPGIDMMHVSADGSMTDKGRAFQCPDCGCWSVVALKPVGPKNEPQPRSYNYGY